MGGHSPSGNSGSADAPVQTKSKVTKVRGEGGIVDFISKGGVTGALIRGAAKIVGAVKKDYKTRKTNESLLGTSDYQGGKTFSKSQVDPRTGKDDNDNNNQKSQKSIEQPKVKSQMNNKEVKSGLIVADKIAPTEVEMTAEEKLVARKRGKKTRTILSSVTGDNSKATLSKKTLLG